MIDRNWLELVASLNQDGMKLQPATHARIGVVALHRQAAEERTPGPPDSERDDDREPEETGDRRGGGVREAPVGQAEHHAAEPRDAGGEGEERDLGLGPATATPEVRAATFELRIASAAAPELDRVRLWIINVTIPKMTSNAMTWVRGCAKSSVVNPRLRVGNR